MCSDVTDKLPKELTSVSREVERERESEKASNEGKLARMFNHVFVLRPKHLGDINGRLRDPTRG